LNQDKKNYLSILIFFLCIMIRRVNKYAVFAISVLTAKILSEHLFAFVIGYKKNANPYIDTLIGMIITAFVFFPALTLMNKYLKSLTEGYLKHSKKITKKSSTGLLWGTLIALLILYYFYLMKWYGIDLLNVLFN